MSPTSLTWAAQRSTGRSVPDLGGSVNAAPLIVGYRLNYAWRLRGLAHRPKPTVRSQMPVEWDWRGVHAPYGLGALI